MFKAKGNNIGLTDSDYLHERNPSAFGITDYSVGSAWKLQKAGAVYKDESYYIEPNFGWLGKINGSGGKIIGGENMKSKISGIGLKITKIEGEPILGNEQNIKWSDLRSNGGWKKKNKNELESDKRMISVQRVAYSTEREGEKKTIVDLGQGVCMLKLPRDNGNVYLVVGVATLGEDLEKDLGGRGRRVGWGAKSKFSDEKWQICHGIENLVGSNPTLNLNWFVPEGGNIRVDRKTVITLGNTNGIAMSWKRPWDKAEKVAVVLGVAVKGEKWGSSRLGDWKEGEETWAKDGEWVNDVKEKSKLGIKGRLDSGIISFKPEGKWEPIIDFKATASAKFSWKEKK